MTRDVEDDFASATMMRLVSAGLARQDIAMRLPPPAGARVSRTAKRETLEAIMADHGRIAILRIADAARHLPPEPVVQAVTNAGDLADLMDRWRRLERFSHARHEVVSERLGERVFRLRHRARDAGPPPAQAETLLVMGLLAALAEMVAPGPVDLSTEDGVVWRRAGQWRDPGAQSPEVETILAVPTLQHRPGLAAPLVADGDLDALRERLAADPVRRWNISDLAAEAGTSSRTLQRRLTERSVTFSRLVAEVRLQMAATHLRNRAGPSLAAIGFLAGYSDQAHFTRSFTKAVGTQPRAYRAHFAR